MLTNTSRLPLQFTWSLQQIHHHQQRQQQQQLLRTAASSKQDHQQQQQLASRSISSCSSSSSRQPEGQLGVTIIPASGRLSPGENLQLQLLLEPLAVGPVKLLCMCSVPGMKTLAGMVITAVIEGLQVAYAVEKPIQPSLAATVSSLGSPGQRQQQQQILEQQQLLQAQAGLLVADFGVVTLHQVTELLLRVTNQTSIDTNVRAWLSRFPAAAAAGDSSSRGTGQQSGLAALGILHNSQQSGSSAQPQHQKLSNMLAPAVTAAAAGIAALGRLGSPGNRTASSTLPGSPAAAAGSGATAVRAVQSSSRTNSPIAARQQQSCSSSLAQHQQQQQGRLQSGSPAFSTSQQQQQQQQGVASRLAQTLSTTGKPGFISQATGQLEGPFRASAGNTMMAARLIASAAAAALGGGCLGCAVDVQPGLADLVGWGDVVMRLLAYNNLPGTYVDVLSVQVSFDLVVVVVLRGRWSPATSRVLQDTFQPVSWL